ncbi:MAG: Lysophospholipase, alpha-beta hydrolase superfamily [Variovorax sp.]|nr:Lysophospholipase, alpha-beta hydrolase superfamily [Variovorax sp.]
MVAHPAQILVLLVLGLATSAILGAAIYLFYLANRPHPAMVVRTKRDANDPTATGEVVVYPRPPRQKALLMGLALVMLLWVFAGRHLVQAFYPATHEPQNLPAATLGKVRGASGADLTVAHYGPAGAPTLVLTHGWGADRHDWDYVISAFKDRFHIVVWDLPGLGESSRARDYSMQTLASDLDSVVSSIKDRPVVLVGHSIGGILNIEYARRFPEKMGRDVRALVQVNTTFTNPVETKKGAEFSRKLQKPVYEPLLHVVTWVSPVARAFGWFAYQSGLAHLQLAKQSFAGAETWDQLDEMASYAYRSSTGVVAQGVLGMLHWDGSDVLTKIRVPTLIISGDEDVTTLPSASDRMERDIPSSVRVAVSRAAHLGPVEQYARYADAIASFMTKPSSGLVGE